MWYNQLNMSVEQWRPRKFFMKKKKDKKVFRSFLKRKSNLKKIDQYKDLLEELCAIRNPHIRGDANEMRKAQRRFVNEHKNNYNLNDCGVWVYYPWQNSIIHFLEEDLHEELRTARNKNLITEEEQRQFRDFPVAIAGLSVGSHAALSIALQGGGREMRLADPDEVSGSNLNRIRAGFDVVGLNKTVMTAQQIYTMDPYAKLKLYQRGLKPNKLRDFLTKPKRIGVLIEETDDLVLKILIRREAKRLGIPVIMAADNGDGIILDIERYDLDRSTPILNGRIKGITPKNIQQATAKELAKMIARMIGPRFVSQRMKGSVLEIGRTLYSWPQLGGAAQMAGVGLAYAARMIATGGPLKNGRTKISLEKILSFNKL